MLLVIIPLFLKVLLWKLPGNYSNFTNFLTLQYRPKFVINVLDENRPLQNLKFYFETEIFSQYKVYVLEGVFAPPLGSKYPLGMIIFQDGYLSKELISISETNG